MEPQEDTTRDRIKATVKEGYRFALETNATKVLVITLNDRAGMYDFMMLSSGMSRAECIGLLNVCAHWSTVQVLGMTPEDAREEGDGDIPA